LSVEGGKVGGMIELDKASSVSGRSLDVAVEEIDLKRENSWSEPVLIRYC
jgi:hypothetical protein